MLPQFRTDLQASREEKQGVVFYRIDHPGSGTRYRLYEIEYLIARKLDGVRTGAEVIDAVKAEYNFDITEPDLNKFVSNLESMGFVADSAAGAGPPGPPPPPIEVPPAPSAPLPGDPLDDFSEADTSIGLSIAVLGLDDTSPVGGPPPEPITETGITQPDAGVSEVLRQQDRAAGLEAAGAAATDAALFDVETAERPRPPPPPESAAASSGEVLPALVPVPEPLPAVDPDRLQPLEAIASSEHTSPGRSGIPDAAYRTDVIKARQTGRQTGGEAPTMLVSGFESLARGEVVLAKDYFVAAQQSGGGDERLNQVVAVLETLGRKPSRAAIKAASSAAGQLFPEIAEQARSLLGAGDRDDLRSRVLWSGTFVLILLAGLPVLYLAAKEARLLESAVAVRVAAIRIERAPVFFAEPGVSVTAGKQIVLTIAADGIVERVAETGTAVKAGDVILGLNLKPAVRKKLDKLQRQLGKARAAAERTATKLGGLMMQRQELQRVRDATDAQLKVLQPRGLMKDRPSKREVAALRQKKAAVNRKLGRLVRQELKPRAQEKKAKARLEQALSRLNGARERLKSRLLVAPFDGVVARMKVTVQETVKAGQRVAEFRDPLAVKVLFKITDWRTMRGLLAGGTVHVAVAGQSPIESKVISIREGEGQGRLVLVKVVDAVGELVETPPSEFLLVREFVDSAYAVDNSALLFQAGRPGAVVWVESQGRAIERRVEVLTDDSNRSVIRADQLSDGDRIVVAVVDGELNDIEADTPLDIRP